jgi:alpha(1,3/1,4) fucosyltransferase
MNGINKNPKKSIKINFSKFWEGFDPKDNIFIKLLMKSYNIIFSDEPDFLIYSCFKGNMPKGKYIKIFYTAENIRPDFEKCDWAFSFYYDEDLKNPRHLRFPSYLWNDTGTKLIKKNIDLARIKQEKTKFCNFVYYNEVPFRIEFFKKLSTYKRIDAPGLSMNNMPPIKYTSYSESRFSNNWDIDKIEFLKPYKFTIAFENISYPGYNTEKIEHPMLANSIPIYWGNPLIHRDFNTKSFINYFDYMDINILIQKIIDIDQNDELYEQYLMRPWFNENKLPQYADERLLEKRLNEIFG